MPDVKCPNCDGKKRGYRSIVLSCKNEAKIEGIIECLCCGHEFPITIVNDTIQKIDEALPGVQSDQLNPSVTPDLKEDIQEAERANYAHCYKACVAMCRRALQLAFIDKGIGDKGFSEMLKEAKTVKNLLDDDTYNLSTTIKGFGDIGVHKREELVPQEVNMVIYATVKMLNELFR